MTIKKTIYIGKTRRKVIEVIFEMSRANVLSEQDYKIDASVTGLPDQFNRSWTPCVEIEEREKIEENPSYSNLNKVIEACSEFDVIVLALAYFRQILRQYIEENPTVKIFELIEGNLESLEIDDIFWTHDCVPDPD